MQVEAIYDQGRLEFTHPLKLKHQRIRLVVDIADDEIVDPLNPYESEPEVLAAAAQMRSRLDAIRLVPDSLETLISQNPADAWLHQMKLTLTAVQLKPDHEIPELSQKQLDRIEAFSYREDR